MADLSRPVVTVEPGIQFGEPHIKGISVAALVGMLIAGEDAATVAADYGVTRGELLVACWFTARYGSRRRRKQWAAWLARHEEALWRGGYDPADVPLPTEEETQ